MKNKTFTYILLIVVAIIWYQVFFRVKDSFYGAETIAKNENVQPISRFTQLSRDTFELKANYRDPFGSTKVTSFQQRTSSSTANSNQISSRPKNIIRWPSIQYFGMVKKSTSSAPLGILNIDGIKLTGRNGDLLFDDIQIRKITRDSIQIRYKNTNRYFLRDGI